MIFWRLIEQLMNVKCGNNIQNIVAIFLPGRVSKRGNNIRQTYISMNGATAAQASTDCDIIQIFSSNECY